MHDLRKEGVIALVSGSEGECLTLTPPLNLEDAVFDSFLKAFNKAVPLKAKKYPKSIPFSSHDIIIILCET